MNSTQVESKPFIQVMSAREETRAPVPVHLKPIMILMLYKRERGHSVWKNRPGLRLAESSHLLTNAANETTIGPLLTAVSEDMDSEKALKD